MKINKLTKEQQDEKLQKVAEKAIINIKTKPSFKDWLMHDKKAFQITFIIGALGGVLTMAILLAISLIFSFNIFFQIFFGIVLIWQGWNAYKMLKNQKNIDLTINDIAYGGKYTTTNYDAKKRQYETTKQGVPA